MANTVSSFYTTLVAEFSKASQLLAPTWGLANAVYWDFNPIPSGPYQTLNIPLPVDPTSQVMDTGAGDIVLSDIGFTTTSVVMDHHPVFAYTVRDFEQFNSPEAVRTVFVDAAMKALKNYVNASIVSLITTGNFTTNKWKVSTSNFVSGDVFYPCAGGTGAAGKCMSLQEFVGVLQPQLATQNVPVYNNPMDMSLVLHQIPYGRLMDRTATFGGPGVLYDPSWTMAQEAGSVMAGNVSSGGVIPILQGTTVRADQQLPNTGSGGKTLGIYLHRYAITVCTRPMVDTPEQSKVVDVRHIELNGNPMYNLPQNDINHIRLPIRVMIGYNQYPKQGHIVSIDAMYGLKVVREYMALPFYINN